MAVGEPASTSWRWEAKECAKVYEFCTTGVPMVPHLQVKACRSSTGVGGVSQAM